MKEQKGITLVALIITIIVMLILVAVSVSVVINSNILGSAKNAGEGYKKAANEESENINVKLKDANGVEKNVIDLEGYVNELMAE